MSTNDQDRRSVGWRFFAAVLALVLAHLTTIVGTEYQSDALHNFKIDQFSIEAYIFFSSPLVLLVLIANQRAKIALGIYAVPVLTIFALRLYHVWVFYVFGTNSMARQKGDELLWFGFLFDALSAVIAALWLIGLILKALIELVQRGIRTK